jgi:hypothetical protein
VRQSSAEPVPDYPKTLARPSGFPGVRAPLACSGCQRLSRSLVSSAASSSTRRCNSRFNTCTFLLSGNGRPGNYTRPCAICEPLSRLSNACLAGSASRVADATVACAAIEGQQSGEVGSTGLLVTGTRSPLPAIPAGEVDSSGHLVVPAVAP